MKYRPLGRTGFNVSEVSFGAWAIGGTWGEVDDSTSLAALNKAIDSGMNFIDTADVYGDGRSERLVAQLKKSRPNDKIYVTTKAGRRLPKQIAADYNRANLSGFIDRSLKNLQTETIDLLQLHCPPRDAYDRPELFALLDDFVKQGKIRFYGASVETVDEALKAITYPNLQSVQIIFNMFRHKPADKFFAEAKRRKVGILARVPLASGMLTGKMTKQTQFAKDDHRSFNRHGEAFDMGETFSGVDYETGLKAVEELKSLVSGGATMAQFALKWILMFDAVSCVIPGAKNPQQAEQNAKTSDLPALSESQMAKVRQVYDKYICPQVHERW